eukprot:gene17254-18979_t
MAYRVAPKMLSTTHDTFKKPYVHEYDYKYYHPELFTNTLHHYVPDKGTRMFFNDYRRSHISEKTLKKNRELMDPELQPIRPTWYSDKPDRVLGKRKIDREAMFPIIQNKPLYLLSNRIPDRERDRDEKNQREVSQHRLQYKDLTGSLHEKSSYFHVPEPSSLTFVQKKISANGIGDYPSHHTSALEYTYNLDRAESLAHYT